MPNFLKHGKLSKYHPQQSTSNISRKYTYYTFALLKKARTTKITLQVLKRVIIIIWVRYNQ